MSAPTPADRGRGVLFHFTRLQLPAVRLPEPKFLAHLERTFRIFLPKNPARSRGPRTSKGCTRSTGSCASAAWKGRTPRGRCCSTPAPGAATACSVDALRARAVRLYPRDEERQDTAVTEFWSNLIAPESEGSLPVLARYDGQRPLAPWLIRVFQNWHLSKLRQRVGVTALPDDEIAVPMDRPRRPTRRPVARGRSCRRPATGSASIDDDERLLLGLRWRYRLSQREAAKLFGLNEGTLTRRTDKLRDRALEQIGGRLVAEGWTGDDLEGFVLTELGALLTDDPRLSADHLGRILAAKGKSAELMRESALGSRGLRPRRDQPPAKTSLCGRLRGRPSTLPVAPGAYRSTVCASPGGDGSAPTDRHSRRGRGEAVRPDRPDRHRRPALGQRGLPARHPGVPPAPRTAAPPAAATNSSTSAAATARSSTASRSRTRRSAAATPSPSARPC